MAITFPISLPASAAQMSSITLRQNRVVGGTASPYTMEDYIVEYQGQWWEADIALPVMDAAKAAAWRAFFAQLNGVAGTFLLGDPVYQVLGAAKNTPGVPLVKGGGQTGKTLLIDGAPNSVAGYLLAGAMIQLGSGSSSRLFLVLEDAASDGSGNVTLTVWPKIVTAPADNAAVVLTSPKGVFRLGANATQDTISPGPRYGIQQFSARSII